MDRYTFNRLKDLGLLTDDDEKILKHLTAIDNLFKKGDCKMSHIFATSKLNACVMVDGDEYVFDSFPYISIEGGDFNDDNLMPDTALNMKLNEMENEY